jgi:hypothetical protein
VHTAKTYTLILVLVSSCFTRSPNRCLLNQSLHNRRFRLPSRSSIISMSLRLIAALTLVSTSINTHARGGSPTIPDVAIRQTGGSKYRR